MSIPQPLHTSDRQTPSATLLLVEDDILQRSTMADFLRLQGFCVLEAGNVVEAKRALLAGQMIKLVLTDIQMPGDEDGIELAEHVQAYYPHVPVLLVSGNFTGADVGQWPFLKKPFHLQKLLSVARTLPLHRSDAIFDDK